MLLYCAVLLPVFLKASAAIIDAETGCYFDGSIFAPGEKIIIKTCLAEMTCLGKKSYGNLIQLGNLSSDGCFYYSSGVCPQKRETDGQSGCFFDGRVYSPGETVTIPSCLGEMKCLGNNNYSPITPLYGICKNKRGDVDGQTGCLFDGKVYAPNEEIIIRLCLAKFTCLGNNKYSEFKMLGQV